MAAAPMGMPGWPELAFWTPSAESMRMVLMQSSSSDEFINFPSMFNVVVYQNYYWLMITLVIL
jgi:hypothetical protein